MRLIDAEALVELMEKNLMKMEKGTLMREFAEGVYKGAIVQVKEAPTVERPRCEWISVEDRLPKRRMECLCLYQFGSNPRYRYYGVLFFNPEEYADNGYVKGPHFNNEGMDDLKVVYWMPLPEKPKIDMRGEGE